MAYILLLTMLERVFSPKSSPTYFLVPYVCKQEELWGYRTVHPWPVMTLLPLPSPWDTSQMPVFEKQARWSLSEREGKEFHFASH